MGFSYLNGIEIGKVTLLTESIAEQTAHVEAVGLDASLDLLNFIFTGELHITSLHVDTVILDLPLTRASMWEGDIAKIAEHIMQTAATRMLFTEQLRLSFSHLVIRDKNSEAYTFSPLSVKRDGYEHLRLSFYHGEFAGRGRCTYFVAEIHEYREDILSATSSFIAPLFSKEYGGDRKALFEKLQKLSLFEHASIKIGYLKTADIEVKNSAATLEYTEPFSFQGTVSRFSWHEHTLEDGEIALQKKDASDISLQVLQATVPTKGTLRVDGDVSLFNTYPSRCSLVVSNVCPTTVKELVPQLLPTSGFSVQGEYGIIGRFAGYWNRPLEGFFSGAVEGEMLLQGFLLKTYSAPIPRCFPMLYP